MEDITLREVCTALGVSRRAVQGYENESLVTATGKNNRGYMLYDSAARKRIKKITILTMAVILTACGETVKTPETTDTKNTNSKQEISSNYGNSSLEGIQEGIENDFSDTIQKINKKLKETNSAVGE